MPPPRPVPTPCVKVCILDLDSGLCLGCYRALQEIGAWSKLTDEAREQIMADLPRRAATLDPKKVRPM